MVFCTTGSALLVTHNSIERDLRSWQHPRGPRGGTIPHPDGGVSIRESVRHRMGMEELLDFAPDVVGPPSETPEPVVRQLL